MSNRCVNAICLALILMCAIGGTAVSQTGIPLFVWIRLPDGAIANVWTSWHGVGHAADYLSCCDAIPVAEADAIANATVPYTCTNGNSGMAYANPNNDDCHWAYYHPVENHIVVNLTTYTRTNGYVYAVFSGSVGHAVCPDGNTPNPCNYGPKYAIPIRRAVPVGQSSSIAILLHPRFINALCKDGVPLAYYYNYYDYCDNGVVDVVLQLFARFFIQDACGNWVALPINVIDGDMRETESDIEIKTPGLPLAFSRTYNSTLEGTNALGPRWTHTYDWRLCGVTNTFRGTNSYDTTNVWKQLRTSDGNLLWFQLKTNGLYESPPDNNYELAATNGAYRVTIPTRVTYGFDSNGVLQDVADLFGNRITLSYTNDSGVQLLARAEHSGGKALEFLYTSNLLTEVKTPSTNLSLLFSCNAAGELTGTVRRISDGDLLTSYAYNSIASTWNHSLTQRVDAAGRIVAWEYDGARSTRSYNSGTGTWSDTSVAYDTNLNVSTVTYSRDGSNIVYQYRYHPVLKRVEAIYGPDSTNVVEWKGTEYTLDDYGNRTAELEADWLNLEWAKTITRYDDKHHVTNRAYGYIAEPSNFWVYAYSSNQTLTSVTDPEGRQVCYEYTNGLVTAEKLVYATNGTFDTQYSYDTNSYLVAVTNANGHYVQYVRGGCCPDEIIPQAGPENGAGIRRAAASLEHPDAGRGRNAGYEFRSRRTRPGAVHRVSRCFDRELCVRWDG